MAKVKVGFEIDERAPALDPARRVLLSVSTGSISIAEAALLLDSPDVSSVLSRLSELGLSLPRLSDEAVELQLTSARSALDQCLLEP